VPSKETGGRWGALNASYPTGILNCKSDLINGTMRFINQNMSPGGLQMNTGWLKNGMWVAISLDNVAEINLTRNEGDDAAKILMSVLNHGTPLYTWCEERGPLPYTDTITGDRQHLWTPVAVVRYIRDALVMEDGDQLYLGRGIDRKWVASGKEVGIKNAPTRFGLYSYSSVYDAANRVIHGKIEFPAGSKTKTVWLARLPRGSYIKSVNTNSGAAILPDGSGLYWENTEGVKSFDAFVTRDVKNHSQ
jgi:hypothetical protein